MSEEFFLISHEMISKEEALSKFENLMNNSDEKFIFIGRFTYKFLKDEKLKIKIDKLIREGKVRIFPSIEDDETDFVKFFGERGKIIKDTKSLETYHKAERKIGRVPMLDPKREFAFFCSEFEKKINQVFSSGKFILGEEVKKFEEEFAKYLGVKYVIGVASGTDALLLSLCAIALKTKKEEFFSKEDIIITTPFTFVATGEAIIRAGATPIFVDIDENDFCIAPDEIENCVKKFGKKIVGIVPVHLFGHSAKMDDIMEIAEKNGLFVVEDVAQAGGGEFIKKDERRKLGSIGDASAFSFFPSKNLGGFGDGGAIATNDDKIAELVKILRNHGCIEKYNAHFIGYNSRLDSIQSALLLEKLNLLDEFNRKRRNIAEWYRKYIKVKDRVKLPIEKEYSFHVYHQFSVLLENESERDKLRKFLEENGVESAVYYPKPLCDMKVFEKRAINFGNLKNAREISKKILSIPCHHFLKENEVKYVSECINEFFHQNT
ncbi:dTDP-3-amino-3,4,6-trideoxy-alpha-D-glucose transaminase [bacterium HR19]|nr:dTDP-3-amino-3,4,6-trideoxy-alpha-D-glucose transaminase [bacterium HR19]